MHYIPLIPYNVLLAWSFTFDICAFVLFIEATLLFRTLFMTRQAQRKYLLFLLPLAGSAWSSIIAIHAWQAYEPFAPDPSFITFGYCCAPFVYFQLQHIIMQAASIYQTLGIVTLFITLSLLLFGIKVLHPHNGLHSPSRSLTGYPVLDRALSHSSGRYRGYKGFTSATELDDDTGGDNWMEFVNL